MAKVRAVWLGLTNAFVVGQKWEINPEYRCNYFKYAILWRFANGGLGGAVKSSKVEDLSYFISHVLTALFRLISGFH